MFSSIPTNFTDRSINESLLIYLSLSMVQLTFSFFDAHSFEYINFLVYSFNIQSFYRLVCTIYHHRLYYQSLYPYIYAIVIQWIIAILQMIPILIFNKRNLIEDDELCEITIHNRRTIVYLYMIVYLIPFLLILIQYRILVKYSKRKTNGLHSTNIQQRARRQVKSIRRILILIFILFILSLPDCTIIIFEVFLLVRTPRYVHRIGFSFVGIASGLIMLIMMYYTRNLRRLLFGRQRSRKNKILKLNYSQQETRGTIRKLPEMIYSGIMAYENERN
ncbi:unnamed protein product [Adineta ricciae]|uniref:G-protein coupled receptors family 1 profile domain-containing protein n=1 Tax=Adineta ricciae TaxID=249248 RepID=A0A814H5G0_ADIRI|nr:unnamed protein product [Adineta ricciae]